jgi:hypothetical protein
LVAFLNRFILLLKISAVMVIVVAQLDGAPIEAAYPSVLVAAALNGSEILTLPEGLETEELRRTAVKKTKFPTRNHSPLAMSAVTDPDVLIW